MATESKARAATEDGGKPKADVIRGKQVAKETHYLIRLREDFDTLHSFHIKKLSDFKELAHGLQEAKRAGTCVLKELPEMPEESRFGIRRQMSKLGLSHFQDRQHEGLQSFLDTLFDQVPNLSADANLQAFFSGPKDPVEEESIKQFVMETRAGFSLGSLKGHWKVKGYEYIWTIDASGRALLDGEHRGKEYDISESGRGLDMVLSRLDGWKVDIEKSTGEHLFWMLAGQPDLEWVRVPDQTASSELNHVATAKAKKAENDAAEKAKAEAEAEAERSEAKAGEAKAEEAKAEEAK